MPSNTTPNYQLNQWDAADRVLRTDFNADNAKIDAVIKALDTKASAKAEKSALDAEVKARQSGDSSLTAKINTINAALPKKGNCQIYYTTYIGTGELSQTVTFPKRPRAVMILGKYSIFRYIDGQAEAISSSYGGSGLTCPVSWSGGSMTWTIIEGISAGSYCCNNYNELYTVIGLIDAAG